MRYEIRERSGRRESTHGQWWSMRRTQRLQKLKKREEKNQSKKYIHDVDESKISQCNCFDEFEIQREKDRERERERERREERERERERRQCTGSDGSEGVVMSCIWHTSFAYSQPLLFHPKPFMEVRDKRERNVKEEERTDITRHQKRRNKKQETKKKKREGRKGREGKGREGKGREGQGREGKGREGKGRERLREYYHTDETRGCVHALQPAPQSEEEDRVEGDERDCARDGGLIRCEEIRPNAAPMEHQRPVQQHPGEERTRGERGRERERERRGKAYVRNERGVKNQIFSRSCCM